MTFVKLLFYDLVVTAISRNRNTSYMETRICVELQYKISGCIYTGNLSVQAYSQTPIFVVVTSEFVILALHLVVCHLEGAKKQTQRVLHEPCHIMFDPLRDFR